MSLVSSFFQVKQVHGPCTSSTWSCILPIKQTFIKKKNVRIPEKKTKWRLKGKRGLRISFGMQNDF